MEKSKRRVPFWTSLSTKIAVIMFFCITAAITLTALVFLTRTEGTIIQMNKNYAQTMAEDYARSLDGAITGGVELTTEIYANMVGGAQMRGIDSSYIYVTDENGIILYHPTESKIGTKAENEIVLNIVSKKVTETSGADVYVYNGSKKMAGYCVSANNLIVVMSANFSDMMHEYYVTQNEINIINLMNMITFTIIALIVCKLFLRTVPMIVDAVGETAEFDFRKNPVLEKLTKRKDELGLISRSVMTMRGNLRNIIKEIDESAESLTENIISLKSDAVGVNSMCTDNSATTQQLAAGMEETSATTESINDNISVMLANAKEIDNLASEGENLSDTVSKRAHNLKQTTVESTKKTEVIYQSVKQKAENAIANAQVVSKINEMTDQIMQISSQTSLLALNASIEAARAGESGRGFAVVATEIGNLATQSANTVKDIDAMVVEVVASVNQMQECLEETTSFIGENVVNDYKEFEKISDQYNSDAHEFKESMTCIRNGVKELNGTIDTVADSISGISTTITEAAQGVTGIAENTSEIVIKTNSTVEKSNDCDDEIKALDAIVSKFILE